MDQVKAKALERQLQGKTIASWQIEKLINYGKSAAVFLARNGATVAAVKIFDDELIKLYGDQTQFARIERELTLIGKVHPSLVKILGGGCDPITKNHYIIMEYLEGKNLKECLSNIPFELIPDLIEQLASAAEFLEQMEFCHRDIKPENIMLQNNFQKLVLLDLGVIRPIGKPGLTDIGGIQPFIGTLQYSSPEFLLRKEEDSIEGWRALTFYQIGGVLHDLVMREPLFSAWVQPYPRLVHAVSMQVPQIKSSVVAPYLINLADRCLIKDPKTRLRLLKWTDFSKPTTDTVKSAKQRVMERMEILQAQKAQALHTEPSQLPARQKEIYEGVIDFLKESIRSIRNKDKTTFPPVEATRDQTSEARLRICFPASEPHCLQHQITIILDLKVIDADADAIDISIQAYIGGETPDTEYPFERKPFYEGLYDRNAIYEAFEELVYKVMEKMQQVCESPNVPNANVWIL